MFFWLKPGGYYLLVLSNIDLLWKMCCEFGVDVIFDHIKLFIY